MLRIRSDGEPCRSWLLSRRDAQPGIEGDDAGRVREQGVDVQLTDLLVIGGELAEADQYFDDSLDLRRWLAAISLQQSPNSGACHHSARQQHVERRQLERGVTHDLDRRASLAERHQRAEYRVFDKPDEELHGCGAANHGLNEEPVKARPGTCRPDAFEHHSRLRTDPIGIAEVERDTADIGFVSDIGRTDLERDRKPDGRCDTCGLVRVVGRATGREWDAISREYGAG